MSKPLSREFLLSRGWCCNLGCQNCPYSEKNIGRSKMTIMRKTGDFNDPKMECDACEQVFTIYWQNDGFTIMEYCPFCGESVEDIVDEME